MALLTLSMEAGVPVYLFTPMCPVPSTVPGARKLVSEYLRINGEIHSTHIPEPCCAGYWGDIDKSDLAPAPMDDAVSCRQKYKQINDGTVWGKLIEPGMRLLRVLKDE